MHLWAAGGPATAAACDEEAYDAAVALVAAGVLTRTPRLLRSAEALFRKLDARKDRCAENLHRHNASYANIGRSSRLKLSLGAVHVDVEWAHQKCPNLPCLHSSWQRLARRLLHGVRDGALW